jgi:hypothetical protein
MKVLAFKPNPKKPEQGFVRLAEMIDVQTDDGRKEQVQGETVEAWTPEIAKVPDLVGKELPDGWTLRDGPKGKQLLPPKVKGEGLRAAWANTEEGEKYVQERMDRRTALMQAVASLAAGPRDRTEKDLADFFYAWLRKSVSEGPPARASVSAVGAAEPRIAQGPPSDTSSAPIAETKYDSAPWQSHGADTISGEGASTLPSTEGAPPDDRREGEGDSAPVESQGSSPSRRQRCLHTEGIRTVTKETGGTVDVCIRCGTVLAANPS